MEGFVELPPPLADETDKLEFWHYPNEKEINATVDSSGQGLLTSATTDPLGKVLDWYRKRFAESTRWKGDIQFREPLQTDTKPLQWVHSGAGRQIFMSSDSIKSSQQARKVKIAVGNRASRASSVTVFISQTEGEEDTHFVIAFEKR